MLAQQSSQIGTFDVSVINFFLDALFDNVLLYPVNEYLSLNPLFTFPTLAGTPTCVVCVLFVVCCMDACVS